MPLELEQLKACVAEMLAINQAEINRTIEVALLTQQN